MRKQIILVVFIFIAFALLLPFASKNPDGLQKLVGDSGAKIEQVWSGLMSGYSIASVGDGYASSFLAGLFGIVAVLVATFVLGKAAGPRKPRKVVKQM